MIPKGDLRFKEVGKMSGGNPDARSIFFSCVKNSATEGNFLRFSRCLESLSCSGSAFEWLSATAAAVAFDRIDWEARVMPVRAATLRGSVVDCGRPGSMEVD
jgi:hypothetical protein